MRQSVTLIKKIVVTKSLLWISPEQRIGEVFLWDQQISVPAKKRNYFSFYVSNKPGLWYFVRKSAAPSAEKFCLEDNIQRGKLGSWEVGLEILRGFCLSTGIYCPTEKGNAREKMPLKVDK